MRYLLTGGGTGGHVYPALAIADEIRRRETDAEFLYVGVRGRLEERVVPGRGYRLRFVRSRPFPRSRSAIALARFALTLGWGTLVAAAILVRFRPGLILCTGGYVSAPVMFACGMLRQLGLCRAKVFVYEPNAHPGLLNQAVGRLADRVGVAFEQAGRWFDMRRVAVVGFPVRRELLEVGAEESRVQLGIPAGKRVLFAFGGSGGSRVINEGLVEALPVLRDRGDVFVLHVTGRHRDGDYDAVAETAAGLAARGLGGDTSSWYRAVEYMDEIQHAYAVADLVICRGGASTLTEVGVCGLPAIVVPLSTAAEDHQAMNARELERLGAAQVLYEVACWRDGQVGTRIDGQRLGRMVGELLDDEPGRRRQAEAARRVPKSNSLELILAEVASLASGRRPLPLSLEFPARSGGLPIDPNALLRWVRSRLEQGGGVAALDPTELAYLRYQADRYLASEAWYEIPLGRRNVGVKLVGHLEYAERLDLVLHILSDRTSVGPLRRLAGGDFRHPGILRRNAIEYAVRLVGRYDAAVEGCLSDALETDPYFEVRAAAAQVLGELAARGGAGPRADKALMGGLTDSAPGVVVQAIRALGRASRSAAVLESLRRYYLHPDWQLRHEVVTALRRLIERDVVEPAAVAGDVDLILATSSGFHASFPLRDNLRELARLVHTPR
ncbi:MAG: glycosyltransferase [Gemmatimonadota bacterium]